MGTSINPKISGKYPASVLAVQGNQVACASTATDEVLFTYTLPAGTLGPNGGIEILPIWSMTSSANNKIIKVNFGAFVAYNITRTASVYERLYIVVINRGSTSSQIAPGNGTGATFVVSSGGPVQTGTVDTTQNVIITVTGNRANAGDTLALESCVLKLLRA
jgi:hypothetical protein